MVMRVAVLMGGRSGEHEVSLRSAASVMAALDRDRWEPVPFGVTRGGKWLTTTETAEALAAGATAFEHGGLPLLTAGEALAELASCDVVFPLIHGTFGEDGCVQGFLEMADLPYAGPGVGASAIGMDKALMKMAFRDAGVPVAREVVVQPIDLQAGDDEIAGAVAASVGYPCFVKPANGGSSVGVTKVRSREDLGEALAAAFAYGEKALIEAAITGSEVECSVLGNERPEASITGEIAPDREFYDYDSKYDRTSSTALHIPARISASASERVRELALLAYRAMGAEGYSRVDFFVDGETVTANEINTIPGFTSISMYPKLWEASGLGYEELLSRILDLALERHGRRAAR